jgi:hypothetical protein
MYRIIKPASAPELQLRMLFQPAGGELFHRAAEADSYRGLVAALIGDPGYETLKPLERLTERIRLAHEVLFLAELDEKQIRVADHDGDGVVNVSSDEPFIRSLDRVGYLSVRSAMDADG